MDEIIRMLLSMGKTREEIAEFVGKEMPSGGAAQRFPERAPGGSPSPWARVSPAQMTTKFSRY